MESIILASASARRQQLLNQIGVHFTVRSQDIDESTRASEPAQDYVLRMAQEKAQSALQELNANPGAEESVVLAADTTVVCDERVLAKPVDEADAVAMLGMLSAREHRVLSAVTVASGSSMRTLLSSSEVRFRQISPAQARAYYRSGEPVGKAGGYAIQGYGAVFVERLTGSYSGVMGLPLFETAQLLEEFAVPMRAAVAGQP